MPIPNDPGLVGVDVFFQGAVVDPQGAWQGIALSRGLQHPLGSR